MVAPKALDKSVFGGQLQLSSAIKPLYALDEVCLSQLMDRLAWFNLSIVSYIILFGNMYIW